MDLCTLDELDESHSLFLPEKLSFTQLKIKIGQILQCNPSLLYQIHEHAFGCLICPSVEYDKQDRLTVSSI